MPQLPKNQYKEDQIIIPISLFLLQLDTMLQVNMKKSYIKLCR